MTHKKYKHIFFDLDHTLWDFNSSSLFTIKEMFRVFELAGKGIPTHEVFVKEYHIHNDRLWELYRNGELKKEVLSSLRFADTLKNFGINDEILAEKLSDFYLFHSPRNVFLFPGTLETLGYLKKKYSLHIITNGFEDVQRTKLDVSGLGNYFDTVITSEEAGVKKPDKGIFDFAINKTTALKDESIMVGDDLDVDILGARQAGIDGVYFNPEAKSHSERLDFEITTLGQLRNYF
ncbi:MAG: YjjG family noncanonical pyrimidine nucleotidase [Bacteroidales bacterium]|nr:YjjG family noncanonical pyrimidine nucleotidase [Bacteroidales bacterium]